MDMIWSNIVTSDYNESMTKNKFDQQKRKHKHLEQD